MKKHNPAPALILRSGKRAKKEGKAVTVLYSQLVPSCLLEDEISKIYVHGVGNEIFKSTNEILEYLKVSE